MLTFIEYVQSNIGKKKLMGLTGLGYCFFALIHMSGNLLLLVGPEAYNKYSHAITSNKAMLYTADTGLVLMLILHVFFAIQVTRANRAARPIAYAVSAGGDKATRLASRSMALSGLVLLAFLILHICTFKFGTYYGVNYEGSEIRDLYRLVSEKFKNPLYTGFYVLALALLGAHLSHGFIAAFQSLGVASVRSRNLKMMGNLFAMIVSGGFILQALYFFLFYSGAN